MRQTITTAICTLATVVAVGAWAFASINADAHAAPAAIASDATQPAGNVRFLGSFGEMPAFQFDWN